MYDISIQAAEAFYRRLLNLETVIEPAPLIAETVELLTHVVDARLGYVELFSVGTDATPFRHAHCDEDPADVEGHVSRDIVRAAVETRTTINVASALDHHRFRTCPSVVANGVRAVLCTPIGIGAPVGVVYLQGRRAPGRFPDLDRDRAELFAAKLACAADRMRCGRDVAKVTLDDEVRWLEGRHVRASLDRNKGNMTTTARELGITRARLYRILKRGA